MTEPNTTSGNAAAGNQSAELEQQKQTLAELSATLAARQAANARLEAELREAQQQLADARQNAEERHRAELSQMAARQALRDGLAGAGLRQERLDQVLKIAEPELTGVAPDENGRTKIKALVEQFRTAFPEFFPAPAGASPAPALASGPGDTAQFRSFQLPPGATAPEKERLLSEQLRRRIAAGITLNRE